MAEKGTFVVPTLAVTDVLRPRGAELNLPPMSLKKIKSLYEKILRAIEICARAGVRIGLGADLLGSKFHELQGMELPLRGEVSPPIEVLRSATTVNAELLQRSGELGCIQPGALADVIVTNFDPLRDLAPFARPEQNILPEGAFRSRSTARRKRGFLASAAALKSSMSCKSCSRCAYVDFSAMRRRKASAASKLPIAGSCLSFMEACPHPFRDTA